MIESHELKNRDRYLKKLIGFQDTEPVKVITGIRRCGNCTFCSMMRRKARKPVANRFNIFFIASSL